MIIDLDDVGKEFAEFLIHAEDRKYDPVKRKEYYERTKKLKGRKKGSSEFNSEAIDKAAKDATKKYTSLSPKEKVKTLMRSMSKKDAEKLAGELENKMARLENDGLKNSPEYRTAAMVREEAYTRAYGKPSPDAKDAALQKRLEETEDRDYEFLGNIMKNMFGRHNFNKDGSPKPRKKGWRGVGDT